MNNDFLDKNSSENMGSSNIDEEKKVNLHSQSMGWTETSTGIATYTRRLARGKAQKSSLDMQERLLLEKK